MTIECESLGIEMMENKVLRNLLTSIRRSYARNYDRMKNDGKTMTRLYFMMRVNKEDYSCIIQYHPHTACFRVRVMATGEEFLVTRQFTFGKDEWRMYRIINEESKWRR
jgi:hypothetical protein